MRPRILIVGGGLAGLALAIGLGQRGLAYEVVEQESTWAPVGAGIGLLPNAMCCLDRLGVGNAVRAAGFEVTATEWLDVTGGSAIRFDWRDVWDGDPVIQIHRHPLVQILADRVTGSVRLGTVLTGLRQAAEGVEVELSDGSAGLYDLVVGADGVYSTVRRLWFRSAPPRYVGQHYWRGALPDPGGSLPRHWWVARAPGRFFGLTPLGGDLVYCFGQLNTDDLVREPPDGRLAHARAVFVDFPPPSRPRRSRVWSVTTSCISARSTKWLSPTGEQGASSLSATPRTPVRRSWSRAAPRPSRTRWCCPRCLERWRTSQNGGTPSSTRSWLGDDHA